MVCLALLLSIAFVRVWAGVANQECLFSGSVHAEVEVVGSVAQVICCTIGDIHPPYLQAPATLV